MTSNSLALAVDNSGRRGSTPANSSAPASYEVPARVVSTLGLNAGLNHYSLNSSYDYHDEIRALSRARHEGILEAIPALADKAAAALEPIERQPLIDRLTMLGMSMAHGKDSEQVKAWLHETARLLSDLPQSVLFDAIDECVKEPGRVFCPTVGEIRDKAALDWHRKGVHAARLRRLANLIAEGVEIPEWQPPTPWGLSGPEATPPDPEASAQCTPEQAAAILEEYGLPTSYGEKLAGFLKPEPPKSRADMIAQGIVPPPIKTEPADSSWDGMP